MNKKHLTYLRASKDSLSPKFQSWESDLQLHPGVQSIFRNVSLTEHISFSPVPMLGQVEICPASCPCLQHWATLSLSQESLDLQGLAEKPICMYGFSGAGGQKGH